MSSGDLIRGKRAVARVSQRQLSKLSGVSTWRLHQIEGNNLPPTVDEIERIARSLEVPPIELLPGSFRAA